MNYEGLSQRGDSHSKMEHYAANQRKAYAAITATLLDAQAAVGADYDRLQNIADNSVRYFHNEYLRRHHEVSVENRELRLLDFGCGVGRLMESFTKIGFKNVDGVDICSNMLDYAKKNGHLGASNFWLTDGQSCGEAPSDTYDMVYSCITMNHISMRQTRVEIFKDMARCLKPGGVMAVQMFSYPSVSQARIPPNHAAWHENAVMKNTNSASDVWITPDSLGQVYNDLRLFYSDIQIQEIDTTDDYYAYSPSAIYQYPRAIMLLIAQKGATMLSQFYGDAEFDENSHVLGA